MTSNSKDETWVPVQGDFSHFGVINRKGELCCDGQDEFAAALACAEGCDKAHPECAPHKVHACFLIDPAHAPVEPEPPEFDEDAVNFSRAQQWGLR